MKYLKISNKGLLDIRLVALMGGTTKSNDIFKIGQFGTGLKYTLAYLLRNEIDFKIFIGNKKVNITLEEENINNQLFKIICINNHRTSITTNMGDDWKPWMIVRELYSNALDEGDAKYEIVEVNDNNIETLNEDRTEFYIQLTTEFLKVYNDWNKYFINYRVPMYENKNFALHPTNENLKIYKQGILIYEDNQKSLFNYDIKNARINELREYTGTLNYDISNLLCKIDDTNIIKYILENLKEENEKGEKLYEAQIDITFWADLDKDYTTINKAWKEVIGDARLIHKEAKQNILAREINIDLSHTIEVSKNLYKALTCKFEGIGALRLAQKINEFYEIYDQELELKIKQCIIILEECNYFIHPELKFIFGEFGDKSTIAKINTDKKEIFISHKIKDKSLFNTISMLIEENEHFQTNYNDHTREFQQHFIDLYTKTLLSKHEIKI